MHLVIHTQYYPPEIGAPQARLSELAHGLVRRGHQVTVLTGMPNYPRGEIYAGYGGLRMEQDIDGVRVVRTAVYPNQKTRLLPRLANYFSFVLSSWLIGGWSIRQPDYILTESPPLFLGLTGYLLSRWKKARWIFNVSDLWPDSAVRLGVLKPGTGLTLSQQLEAFCYQKAWLVTGQSQSILENIHERFPGLKTYHLSNGVDTDVFHPDQGTYQARSQLGGKQALTVLYAGLHGLAQGLEQVLQAARFFQDEPDVKFVFLGDGPCKQDLIDSVFNDGLKNVSFLDPVSRAEMPAIVASADICVVPLKTYLPGAVPSKLYEIMASARPLILVAEGEATEIITRNKAGLVAKPGNIEELAAALRLLVHDSRLRQSLGEAGRKAATSQFDRRKIIDRFAEYLDHHGEA